MIEIGTNQEASGDFLAIAMPAAVRGLMTAIKTAFPQLENSLNGMLLDTGGNVKADILKMLNTQGGESGVVTTLYLFEVMLAAVSEQTQAEIVKWLVAHHGPEMFSDALDQEAYRAVHRVFCDTAIEVLREGAIPGSYSLATLDMPEDHPVICKINRVLELMQSQGRVSFAQALMANLGGNLALRNHVQEVITENPNLEWLGNFVVQSLVDRYLAQKQLVDVGGYAGFDTVQGAITNRAQSILIKATMGVTALHMLAEERIDVSENKQEMLQTAMDLAATLIGLLNDIGTYLLFALDRDGLNTIVNDLQKSARDVANPIEALRGLRTKVAAGQDVGQLVQQFRMLVKDAGSDAGESEWNLVLDQLAAVMAGGDDGWKALREKTYEWSLIASQKRQDLLRILGELSGSEDQTLQQIAGMIRAAVEFHAQLYQGGDYYNADASGGQLPIMNGNFMYFAPLEVVEV